jgi:presenilin-like A22 family membrane protease
MEGQLTVLRSAKSIVGTALLVLGTFILYENLAGAVGRLSHVLANGSEALGLLPAVVLAASQPVHAYAVDHHRFMLGLFQQVLASSWPLLLVIFGSVLSRDTFTDKSKHIQENTVDPPFACAVKAWASPLEPD